MAAAAAHFHPGASGRTGAAEDKNRAEGQDSLSQASQESPASMTDSSSSSCSPDEELASAMPGGATTGLTRATAAAAYSSPPGDTRQAAASSPDSYRLQQPVQNRRPDCIEVAAETFSVPRDTIDASGHHTATGNASPSSQNCHPSHDQHHHQQQQCQSGSYSSSSSCSTAATTPSTSEDGLPPALGSPDGAPSSIRTGKGSPQHASSNHHHHHHHHHHFFEAFRPRSKSDSKGSSGGHASGGPRHGGVNIVSAIKNSVHNHHWFSPSVSPPSTASAGSTRHHNHQHQDNHHHQQSSHNYPHHNQQQQPQQQIATSPDGFDYKPQQRPRSGSESKGGAVAKVMDIFRTRSQSMSLTPDAKAKRFSHNHSGSLLRRHSVDPDRRRHGAGDGSAHHHTALIHRAAPSHITDAGYSSLPVGQGHQTGVGSASALGLAASESSICDRIDIEDLGADETMLFVKFFRYYHCYDLIPLSAKLVVFDTQLLVKKAFFALVSNGVRAAPLWDSAQQAFVGMLTITDFIHILRKFHGSPTGRMDELEEHKIATWRTVLTEMQHPLVSIGPDASLCDAIATLIQQRVHRLPVIDPQTGNVLYVLTHKRILRFLFLYFYDLPHASYLDQSIRDLNVGSFDNIATCTSTTSLITALNTFAERRVSALPVIDEEGKVIDIYAKFDVINLAAEKTYNNLDITVGAALEFRNQYFEGVMTCKPQDTLLQVMEKIVRAEVHRLVIVNDDNHVVGMISLSDILTYLVLRPLGIGRPACRVHGLPQAALYARTTSLERENGTVEEEPELEAKANVHGEGVVECERKLLHKRNSAESGSDSAGSEQLLLSHEAACESSTSPARLVAERTCPESSDAMNKKKSYVDMTSRGSIDSHAVLSDSDVTGLVSDKTQDELASNSCSRSVIQAVLKKGETAA